jgi:hypothetical protein
MLVGLVPQRGTGGDPGERVTCTAGRCDDGRVSERIQHARPAAPARHARRLGAALTRGRFRPLALVPALMLGLGGGAATAVTLGQPEAGTPVTAADDGVATQELRVGDAPAASGDPSAGVTGDASPANLPAEEVAVRVATAGPPLDSLEDLVPDPWVAAQPVPDVPAADLMAGLLSLDTPQHADGDLVVVPGTSEAPDPDAPVRTVRVEVEAGLPVDGERFARLVMGILNDPRGWGHGGALSFARTDGDAQIRVVLASPDKVDEMCAPLATHGDYSCGRYGHAAINYTRWVTGAPEFDDLTLYRQYVINHEVGHLLGHQHASCPGTGEVAPIMQQQSIHVAPCLPNGWPYPDAT